MSDIINLLEHAQRIGSTAKTLVEQARTTGKPVSISANKLTKKIPELAKLPDDWVIFRIRAGKDALDTTGHVDTLRVFIGDDGIPGVFGADLTPLDGFTFKSYQIAIGSKCHAVVEHESGVSLQIGIGLSDEYRTNAAKLGVLPGQGMPPSELIAETPHPTIPLKDLPEQSVYTIVRATGNNKRYGTLRLLIQDEHQNQLEVLANAALERMFAEQGCGAKFKVTGKRPKVNSNLEPVDATGEVNRQNPAWIVEIFDVSQLDFSDLVV